ncbi:MAG TPA: Ig-like domain-containing protein, partial [Polyangiaceae bacterium]|nr:Ig-like domain-containing protein [Polyangiaceae bacterium]
EYTNATDFVKNAGATSVVSVVIILGANDSKPQNWEPAGGKNDQQYLKDYRALVEHFAALPTKPVIYLGYPLATGNNPCCNIRGNIIHDEQLPLIKQLAMEKRLPIIDLNTPTTGHPEYFGDGVHPNDSGYAVMAGLVKKGLEREPSVSITSPLSGAIFSGGAGISVTAEVMADAVDVTSVEFLSGTNSMGKVTTKPFTVVLPGAPGMHSITAKATDATLANATSAPVSFLVNGSDVGGAFGTAGSAGSTPGGAGGVAAGAGGLANGGAGANGAGAGGVVATAGSAGSTAGAPSGNSGSGPVANPTTPTSTSEANCGCSTPGSGPNGAAAWLLVASALGLVGLRRRAA